MTQRPQRGTDGRNTGSPDGPATSVLAAAPSGSGAAGAVTADPVAEDARRAAREAPHEPFSAASEARLCELAMGDRRHGI
ncbi:MULTISPECIES: hypothetical protein [unclassified Streptomyces]|uniref:hypothetical protein n=1 Tax=unclassified Streptomyces TaxID=2593676 RepID=UPI002E7A59B2|nr:hypothetical protein [Streptomyces sp. JV176]MEE1798586.1 hypothetical protein [Streptomyces sp. JV176]